MVHRKGCIYSEIKRNTKGRVQRGCGSAGHLVRDVGFVPSETRRWVGEITIQNKRYRFRSTNLYAVQAWLKEMVQKYGDLPCFEISWEDSMENPRKLHRASISELKK